MVTHSRRMPLGVYALAASIFSLGTSEASTVVIQAQIMQAFHLSLPEVGSFVSVFALGMLIGAPFITIVTLHMPKKNLLVGAGFVMCATHIMSIFVTSYSILIVLRIVMALAGATELTMSSVIARSLVTESSKASSFSKVIAGMTVANIFGLPLMNWLATTYSWKTAYVVIAVFSLVGTCMNIVLVHPPQEFQNSYRSQNWKMLISKEGKALFNRHTIAAFSVAWIFQAAFFTVFAYLQKILTLIGDVPTHSLPPIIFLFGIGTFIGIIIGGRFADASPWMNIIVGHLALFAVYTGLIIFSHHTYPFIACIFCLGIVGYSITAADNARITQSSAPAPTLGMAFNIMAFNIGIAVGPLLTAQSLRMGHSLNSAFPLGICVAGVSFVLVLLTARQKNNSNTQSLSTATNDDNNQKPQQTVVI